MNKKNIDWGSLGFSYTKTDSMSRTGRTTSGMMGHW